MNEKKVQIISEMSADNVIQKELDYRLPLTKSKFIALIKWDIAFDPKYKILNIEAFNDGVKVRVSKEGKRIHFLHEKPIITEEFFEFTKGKISTVGTTKYISFDQEKFVSKRIQLRKWVDDQYPELNGFLYEQTPEGAVKYLKAIAAYDARFKNR